MSKRKARVSKSAQEQVDEHGSAAAEVVALEEPKTDDQLHSFIHRHLGFMVPRIPVEADHAAPFDYVSHAFFGDRGTCSGPPPDMVVWANRGGGKTFLGALATLLDMLFKPGIAIRILGGSAAQSRHMLAHLRALLDPVTHPSIAAAAGASISSEQITFANGSQVQMLAQSHTSVRGVRVQKLRCDEVDLFKPDVWEACQLTTISKRCGEHEIRGVVECLSTMQNPHGLMHQIVTQAGVGARRVLKWGVLDVLGECGKQYACHDDQGRACVLYEECQGRAKARGEGNHGHLCVQDAVSLKQRVGLNTWKTEMLCHRPRRDACVYPEFDVKMHVIPTPLMPAGVRAAIGGSRVEGHSIAAGMDFGFANPSAVVWGCVDDQGTLWIYREYEQREQRLAEQAAMIADRSKGPVPAWMAIDPAGLSRSHHTGKSSVRVLEEAGLCVKHKRSALQAGIEGVRARLRPAVSTDPPKLFVSSNCKRLIECLECYSFPRTGPLDQAPLKGTHDHLADALRYLVICLGRGDQATYVSYCAA